MPSYILKTLDEVVDVFLNIIETNVIITILPYTHIYAVPPATTSLFNAKILTETPKLLIMFCYPKNLNNKFFFSENSIRKRTAI